MKIKKNGRLGQPQAGVDVYAIPSGYENYWGIQCKGKDSYKNSKLTTKEIDTEISNAKKFKPKLEVFIFCTTAVKDSKIEEYVRITDIENRKKGSFEVLLYSWEDIADLIDENRDTYNWYVDRIQFKDQFDIQIDFFGVEDELVGKPKFKKITTRYIADKQAIDTFNRFDLSTFNRLSTLFEHPFLGSNKVNHSWCSFETVIKNTGSTVIEDWKFYLYFDENVKEIDDDFTVGPFISTKAYKYRTTWAHEDDKKIVFSPFEDRPLIQKDSRKFKSSFIPKFESTQVVIRWELLARDYSREGTVNFEILPEYESEDRVVEVECKSEEREEIEILEFIEMKERN